MNDVSKVPRLPVRPIELDVEPDVGPVEEGHVEALEDKLVPVEEEQLPQGVTDLLATMIWRQRPLTGVGRVEALQSRAPDRGLGERPLQAPRIQSAVPDQSLRVQRLQADVSPIDRPVTLMPIPVPMPKPQPMATPNPTEIQLPKPEVDLPSLPSIERSAAQIDPVLLDQALPPIEQVIPESPIDFHPKTLPIAHSLSNTPSVVLPVTAPTPNPASPPVPLLELPLEKSAPPHRDFLQVPFNKGAANGLVTITRLPGESIQNLVLSPSNPQVFEQLREPFEHARDSRWQLNEHRDEQQHQGSRQSPNDEQEEPQDMAP